MIDLLITGGTVIDGTGGSPRLADVAVDGGRVVAVFEPGASPHDARRTIDAQGLVVAPGFVDVHTHFDAQVFWDPACTPSVLHGVTTVFAGNCGFSIAPLPDDGAYLMRLLSRVEGIPLDALEAGVPWSWRSFGDYLDTLEAAGTSVNFGALVGHSALRRTVLGTDSQRSELRPGELEAMQAHLRAALEAGAVGFSSSWSPSHVDGEGDPVPSRRATADELVALCGVLAEFDATQVEFTATNAMFEDHHLDVMTDMALAAVAPLNWNVLIPYTRAMTDSRLRAGDHARARGATVIALSYPDVIRSRVSFNSSAFDPLPGWAAVMVLDHDAKLAALADPVVRAALRAGAESVVSANSPPVADYAALVVADTYDESRRALRGRSIGGIALETGQDAFDVLCDLVIADDLRTGFIPRPPASDDAAWAIRAETWHDDRIVIGASDGGAHLDMLTTFDYPVRYLALARSRDDLDLARVVHQLTDVPARLYNVADRGRLVTGAHADIVIFDADTVDAGPIEWRNDLPARAGRLYAEPVGIAHVLVNGVEVVGAGELREVRPGTVLRRGRDLTTDQ